MSSPEALSSTFVQKSGPLSVPLPSSFDTNGLQRSESIVGPNQINHSREEIEAYIDSLKKETALQRNNYIQERIEENKLKLVDVVKNHIELSNERSHIGIADRMQNLDLLAKRMKEPVNLHSGFLSNIELRDNSDSLEQSFASSVTLCGSKLLVNNSESRIKLAKVEKIPKYCTWVSLNRNQRMTEEQARANRRRIYHDQYMGDALVCSDSDNEKVEEQEEKKDFTEAEDNILRNTVQEFGLFDLVMDTLAHILCRNPSDLQARCDYLKKGGNDRDNGIVGGTDFYKDLDAALDSFDNLFCCRCLVFDCRLHRSSPELILPAEKQTPWCPPDTANDPCGPKCHLQGPVARSSIAGQAESTITESSRRISLDRVWSTLEKTLFKKGLEIFGRNSCLITRNVMIGLKTCSETFMYMNNLENEQVVDGETADVGDLNNVDGDESTGKKGRRRLRFVRQRGKVRRLKYKPKSSGYPLFRKNITIDGLNPIYNPCGCQSSCGNECGCIVNMTLCEKYCGCPESCKNLFRGCRCAKSHCQTRQCPCFAANRECDPDVCKNCCISCGDGTLEAPPMHKDETYECRNMKILLGQRRKIVLGRSDLTGWGAFLTCDVGKDEFLGEYTGEAISHYEADKRGKRYDSINWSYLFDLNNQVALDSFGMGSKLKFANHSHNPNCYAKIMMVAGDHRVGIYSKKPIKAGEEIFYDYKYHSSVIPAWAMDPSILKKKKKKKDAASASTSTSNPKTVL